jgi:hypothetical protein
MAFSATDAAFEGFRLARRRPLTVVALSALALLSSFGTYWLMDASGYMQAANALNAAGPSPDPSVAMSVLGPLFKFLIGVSLMGCLVTAIQAGAVYRGVLRPDEHGFMGLAFGADELRLAGLGLIIVLLAFLGYIVAVVLLAIVIGIVGAGAAMSGGGGAAGPAAFVMVVAALGVLAAFIAVGVKLSFAGPASLASRRLTVFGSWSMTRGHFWTLIGCYVLAFFLALLVGFIMFVVALIAASLTTGTPFAAAAGEFFRAGRGAPIELFSPVRVVYTLVAGLFGGLLNMVVMAPAAEAYRQICMPGTSQAETFA